jgi:RNA ligase (TIGR02306 family)
MANSTHKVEVTPIKLEPHPNADTLSIARIFDGYICVVKTTDWQDGQLGAYIPPDSIVDSSRPEFAFLQGHERIRVKRLRGVVSMGLLMPAPAEAQAGEDLAAYIGVTHYEPPLPVESGGATEPPPAGYHPKFDVDSLRRYASVFVPGELVWVTEKIHGASARFCWRAGRMYCGSRAEWKQESQHNLWWRTLRETAGLAEFCEQHPEITVYGEAYGQVQSLKYGTQRGEIRFAVFDLLRENEWLNPEDARDIGGKLPWVPLVARATPFDLEKILVLAEGPSLVRGAEHVREGVVVKPMQERTDPTVGRVCLKVVGNGYLEKG